MATKPKGKPSRLDGSKHNRATQFGQPVPIKLAEFGEDTEPKWNMLFPRGKTKHRPDFPDGQITFDDEFLGTMLRNFRAAQQAYMGDDGFRLPITVAHPGPSIPENTNSVDRLAARGFMIDLDLRTDGLWALCDFNDDGRQLVLSKKFIFFSPEFHPDYFNSNTGLTQGPTLLAVSLLNDPFLKEMPRVAASDQGGTHMAAKKEEALPLKTQLARQLGLDDEASDASIMDAIGNHMKSTSKLQKQEEEAKKASDNAENKNGPGNGNAHTEPDGDEKGKNGDGDGDDMKKEKEQLEAAAQEKVSLLTERVQSLEKENKEAKEKLAAMEKREKETEVNRFCETLIKAGKIVPAQRERVFKLGMSAGLAEVEALYKDAPVSINLSEIGHSNDQKDISTDKQAAKAALDKRAGELVKEAREAGRKVDLSDAMKRAGRENPQAYKLVFG